jgi:hypothetical protein
MTATYEVRIDLTGDRDFNDANEDVSAYWKRMSWRHGMAKGSDQMGRDVEATVVFDNQDKLFSPEDAAGLAGFQPGALLRIRTSNTNEAAAELGNEGIGDYLPAPKFVPANSADVDIYSTGLNSAFDGSEGTLGILVKVSASSVWTDGTIRWLARIYSDGNNFADILKLGGANDDVIAFRYKAGGTLEQVNLTGQTSTAYRFYVITWSATDDEVIAYVDGVQTGSTQTGLGTYAGALNANFCRIASGGGASYLDGYGAHCFVIDRAATSAEVATMQANRATFTATLASTFSGNVVAHWPMSEDVAPSGASALDVSGNALHGTYSTTTRVRQHFIGRINKEGIRVAPDITGRLETTVRATGIIADMLDVEASVAVQEDKTIDQILEALLDATGVFPAGVDAWLIDKTGFGELEEQTTLGGGAASYGKFDSGVYTFNYVGDNWDKGVKVYRAVKQLIEARGGWVFEDEDGELVYWNYQKFLKAMALARLATISDTDTLRGRTRYDYGGNLLNSASGSCRPRTVGTSAEVLGTARSTPRIKPGVQPKPTAIRYKDDTGNRIGGKDIVPATANTDWTVNTEKDGSGRDLTSQCSVVTKAFGNKVELTFTNNAGEPGFLLNPAGDGAGAQIRGIKITDFGEVEVFAEDKASIQTYEREYHEDFNWPLLDDAVYCQRRVNHEVALRRNPAGVLRVIAMDANVDETYLTRVLGWRMGTRFAYTEQQIGVDGDYFILGIEHDVRHSTDHVVRYILKPAPTSDVWLLEKIGFGELGTHTELML